MPGTDHAGIATQTVWSDGFRRRGSVGLTFKGSSLSPESRPSDEYEATITEQLKAMGCSCDWGRQRSMDYQCRSVTGSVLQALP